MSYTFKIDGQSYFFDRFTKNRRVDAFDTILLSVLHNHKYNRMASKQRSILLINNKILKTTYSVLSKLQMCECPHPTNILKHWETKTKTSNKKTKIIIYPDKPGPALQI